MQDGTKHEALFERAPSGLLLPAGSTSELWKQGTSSYAHIKSRAIALVDLIRSNGLDERRSQWICRYAHQVAELSDAWLCNQMHTMSIEHLMATLQIDRITQAASDLQVDEASRIALDGLLTGNLDLLQRDRSKAKDTLWELELHHMLMEHGIPSHLREPDILFSLTGPSLGVACKKLYSEANVSKVISNAIAQIERDAEFGIVALNIDDLLPAESVLKAPTTEVMSKLLVDYIDRFMGRHERHLHRYLKLGRALSMFVSCATLADVEETKTRFINARQSVALTITSGLSVQKKEQMDVFVDALSSCYAA